LLDVGEIQGEVVGFSMTATNRQMTLLLARRVRERFPNKKIIFGGYALYYESDLRGIPLDLADAICRGEGEHTLRDVLARGFKNLDEVPGLYLPGGEGWRLTRERPPIPDLNDIPWPTFEEVDLGLYGIPDLPLMSSRGCIGRCVFCNDRHRAPGYRTRSAVNQVDELQYLKERYDTDFFIYNDPLMNGSIQMLNGKADEILRRGLKVQYGGNLMVHPGMKPELFQKLRRSGLTVAVVGMESGSTDTLRQMRKYHNAESGAAFIRNCHNAGMRVELNIIVGFPTETERHFQETMRFIRDNRGYIDCIVSVATFQVAYSDLWWRKNEYDIEMDTNAETSEWRTRDGQNTFEVRLDRLNRFIAGMTEMDLIPNRTDRATEQKSPEVSSRFLEAYSAYWRADAALSPDQKQEARLSEKRIRGRLRRVSVIKACRKLGVLDQALWLKNKFRGV
jgi:radical SAM superfamily enzyme YgiQ (UPF0313 family)